MSSFDTRYEVACVGLIGDLDFEHLGAGLDALQCVPALMGYAGDWERGVELTTKAMELNPHHPGWYRFTTFFNSYHQKRYEEALAIVQKMNLSEYFATHYATAIAQAQLGNISEAQGAVQECLRLWPEFEQGILSNLEKWMYAQPDLIEHIVEGLELAGLDVRGAGERQGADG